MSEIRGSEIRGSEIRGSKIRGSEIRVSEIRGSEIRGSEIRVSEIRISSNHRELHGAIFCPQSWRMKEEASLAPGAAGLCQCNRKKNGRLVFVGRCFLERSIFSLKYVTLAPEAFRFFWVPPSQNDN